MTMISILISTHKSLRFLKTCCLPSVFSQTYNDYEILIANEGEDSEVRSFLQTLNHPNLHYFEYEERSYTSHHNRWCTGGTYGLNLLLDKAKGTYIAHIDHDDIWFPDALEKRVKAMEANPEVDFIYGMAFRSQSKQWFGSLFKGIRGVNTLHHFTVLYKQKLIEVKYTEVGESPADYERWYKIFHTRKYKMAFLNQGIGIYNEGKTPEKTPLPELEKIYLELTGLPLNTIT